MLATALHLPINTAGLAVEWKWDGWRCLARRTTDGQVRLDSRAGETLAESFPEIVTALAEAAPGRRLAFDGELVVLGPTGVPDFERLQRRLAVNPSPTLRERHPVSYIAFDLLDLDGDSTMEMPYEHRRDLLVRLALTHPRLVVPDHQVDVNPDKVMEIANTFGLEGIVCKRRDSRYRPGRSTAWTKHPIRKRLEVVIGGWLPGQAGTLGALLVGRPVASTRRRVEFVGAVGTGWSVASGRILQHQLEAILFPQGQRSAFRKLPAAEPDGQIC
jgi:bifunctional non-homologous end joining protein LigD